MDGVVSPQSGVSRLCCRRPDQVADDLRAAGSKSKHILPRRHGIVDPGKILDQRIIALSKAMIRERWSTRVELVDENSSPARSIDGAPAATALLVATGAMRRPPTHAAVRAFRRRLCASMGCGE